MDDITREAMANVDARWPADRRSSMASYDAYIREIQQEERRLRRERTWWMRLWRKVVGR